MYSKIRKSLPIVAMVAILVLLVSLTATLPSLTNPAEAQENDNGFFEVLSGTSGNSDEGPENLFDGKKTEDNFSKWCANGTTGTFIIKAQEPITISSYTFYTANDNAKITGRNPKSWNLAGCNDYDETTSSTAGGWYSIHAVSNDTTMQDVNYTGYTFTTENMRQYKYYMLQITANQGNNVTQLGEIEFTYSTCEHSFVKSETNIQATCTEPEYELHTCSVCQETRKIKTSTNALGHDWVTESTVDATCTEAQKLHQKCSRCEATQIIDGEESALGHSYNDELTTEPTCTEKGERTYTCTVCGDVYTESVDANGHSWGDGTLVSVATCTTARVESFTCENCKTTESWSVGYPLGHEYVNGTCLRCGKASETGVTVGAFTVIGGTQDVDYKYETSKKSSYYSTPYNVLTILTSTRLTIANTDPDTATYTDRIEIAYGVSANITLAGVNIDLSWSTYDTSSSVGDSALTITENSVGDVVITLADGTVNYLYGGKECAGLQKHGEYGTLTINGTGTLYAYGGQGAAGIGSGRGDSSGSQMGKIKRIANITIEDCTIIAKGGRLTGGALANNGGSWAGSPGIGTGKPQGWDGEVIDVNLKIINAIVTAEGYSSSGIGPYGDDSSMNGITIVGGSVKATQVSHNAYSNINSDIGGKKATAEAPVNDEGTEVYLLEIANDNGEIITLDGEYYVPIAHSSTDKTVYAYVTGYGHEVWVGSDFAYYEFDSDTKTFTKNDSITGGTTALKAFTVTAAGDTAIEEGTDYTYENGLLTILSSTPMMISSNGIATTDRIKIAVDGAQVTLNNVNIDASSVNDSAMLVLSANNVYIYLAEGSVNTLRSASGHAGLELNTRVTETVVDTTFIQGISSTAIPGVLNAYGGDNGAGIGGCFGVLNISWYATVNAYGGENGAGIGTNSGEDSKYSTITIGNSNVLAVGGENGAGIGLGNEGVAFQSGAIISLSGGVISAIGGKAAPGIGAGSGNVEIYSATVYAVGGNDATTGYGISGNKIIISSKSSVNAVGGLDDSGARVNKFSVAPVNSSNGALALLVIANPNGEKVKVDNTEWAPYNSAKIEDTNLYLYVTEEDHTVAVGETSTTYYYIDGAFHVSSGTLVSGIIDGTHYHWYSCADEGCEAKINATACTAGEELLTDDDYHWHECSVCGQALVKTAHTYDQEVVADKYLYKEATCTANALYYYSCVCGHCNNDGYFKVEGTALGHDFDNSTKYSTGLTASDQEILGDTYHCKQCDRCGILQIDVDPNAYEEHQYATTCSADCLKCGYKRSDEELVHNWSTAWTSEGGNHYYKCLNEGCSEKNELVAHTFTKENGEYNYERKIIDGVYYHACTCTVCGSVLYGNQEEKNYGWTACTFETKYDDTNHWEECKVCDYIKPGTTVAHTFDNACDKDCNGGCGYTRDVEHDYSTAWVSDNDNHWHECTRCHDKKDVTAHTLVKCYDDTAHWEKCTVCEKELPKTAHSYNNGEYTCTGCAYIKATPLITDDQPRLNFTYSGYSVGGNVKDFKVASDKDNFGIEWDNDIICGYYWWILDDLEYYNSIYAYWNFGAFGTTSDTVLINSYFRPNTTYWVGLYLEIDDTHYFEDFAQGNVYIEGLGYPVYVYTGDVYWGYVYAYFELPELTGEEPEISQMSDIEFELTGYELGESILTTDVTGATVFSFEVAPSGANRAQALEYYTTFMVNGYYHSDPDDYAGDSGVFEENTWYSLEITVFAPEGYDFTSYNDKSITLKIGDTVYNAQQYYIYNEGKCGVVDYYFDLPFLGNGHEHTWVWDWGYAGHYRYCEVCDYYEDYVDHVWDDDDDCACDICGYVRWLSVNSLELTLNGYEAGKKVVDSTVSANAGFEKYITEAAVESRYYLRGGDYYDYSEIYDDDESLYLPGEVYELYIDITFGSYEYNEKTYDYLFSALTCSDIKVYIEGYGYVTPIGIYFYSTSIDIDVVLPAVADSEECGITKISGIEYTLSGAQVGNKLSDLVLTPVNATGVDNVQFVIVNIEDGDTLYVSTDETTELTFDSSTQYAIYIICTAKEGYTFTGIEESSVKLNGAYEYLDMMLTSPQAMSGTLYWAYSFLVTDEAHKHDFDDYDYDETYHWKVCECGQKGDIEEHDFANGYCVKCGYSNEYDITSVNLYLEGYKYGSYVRDIDVLCDNVNVVVYDWDLGTSDNIFYEDESSILDESDWLYTDTEYYLCVVIYCDNGCYFVNLSLDDVTLEGHGTAVKIMVGYTYAYVLFKLDTIKAPHVHTWTEADKVDAVPATCVKQGSIEYYVCATCGKAVDEEGKELTHDEIVTDTNSDNHTYKVYHNDYMHGKMCSGCGKTTEMGYHYYTDGKDDICDYEGCGHQREPMVNAEFELSGYEVGGKIKDIMVALGANAQGVLWDGASYEEFWWCVITDIDAHFSSLKANNHVGTNYFYETTNFNGYPEHDCFRSGVDYWLIVWVEADAGYRVNGLTNEDIYIEGLGVAYYFDTYYIDYGYEMGYAYFKLNKLEGECDIEVMPDIAFDIEGYEVDAPIADLTATIGEGYVVNDIKVQYGFRIQDERGPQDGETFGADKYYTLAFYIDAGVGYDFYGFTADKVTLQGTGVDGAVCTGFEVVAGFGGIYVEFALPALHEHAYGNYDYEDAEQHYKVCSTCGHKVYSDHIYDNADDATCNDCGYVRKLYVNKIDLTLSGYEIDQKVNDLTLSATADSSKYIAYDPSEGIYYLGIEGVVCYTYGKENGSYMTFTSDSDLTFRPGTDYEVGIVLMLDGAYALSSDAVITLDGVELTQVFDVGNGYVIAIATLPVLEGESEKTTISGAEFTLTGYEIGAKLSDVEIKVSGTDGIGYYGVAIYDSDNKVICYIETDGEDTQSTTTDEVFQKETVYYIMVVMQVKDGYTLYGTLPTNIKINGVNAVDYSSVTYAGDDDDYDMYSYYTAMGIKCSLPVLTDEAHAHSYCVDYGYDATSHWHYCDVCGHKKDVAEHVYADKYDFTCEICGYVRTIEITSITLYLRTYTYGQPAQSLFVEHYADGVELYYDGYGYNYFLSPDIGIAYGFSSNYVDGKDLLLAGIKYYLRVGLELKNGYGINNLNAQNIALDGYGTAIAMTESSGCLYVTFELPALEEPHVHEGTWYDEVPATCVAPGTKAHTHCDACGKDFDAEGREITDLTIAIDPDAHSFGTWHAEVPATCTDDGVKGYKDCTLCGKHFDANGNEITNLTISALGHNADGTIAHKDADCTDDGVIGGTYCTRCNNGKAAAETVIPALGHNADGTIAHKDADCTDDGIVGGTYCTRCNDGRTAAETAIPALGHDEVSHVGKAATCTEAGYEAYVTCSRCDHTTYKVIDALGHAYGDLIAKVNASCIATGFAAHYECSVCHKLFDENKVEKTQQELTIAIDATAHGTSLVKVEAVPATAGSVGNIEYYYCSSCGKYYSDATAMTEISLANTVIGKLAPTVIEGNGGEWGGDAQSGLAFKSDASLEDFIGITVDGIELSPDNYVVGTDELTISLKPEFLATLTDGDHTIEIHSESGQATTTFKVTAVVTPSGDNGSDAGNGDEGLSAGAWVGIAFGIAGGVAGIAIGVWYLLKYLKRRKTPMPIQTEAPVEPEAQPTTEENSDE